jgi:hypothetical protein
VNEQYTLFGYGSPDPSIDITEPFPATMVIASIASVVVVGGVLAFYFRKRNRNKR